MDSEYDLIVIGGGAAGLAAAQYGARANLKTLLVEELAAGGQALLIDALENYPGVMGPVSGYDLSETMRKQAEAFGDWRREQITRLVRAVSQEAHKLKPGIKVSTAVFGNWESARKVVGQDAKAWVDAGYLDFVCPMDYESADADFSKWVRSQVAAINHKIPCYAGIGAYRLSGPEQLAGQIQLSRQLGADGFVIFNLTEKLATQFLLPLRLGVTSTPPLSKP